MKKGWIFGIAALVAVAIVAGGGYYLFFQNKVQSQVEAQLRQFFANPPPPYTKATYGKLDVALASRSLTIDNIVLERSAPPFNVKIAHLEATGIDDGALQAIFDPAQYKTTPPDATMRKLADTLTLTGVETSSRDGGSLGVQTIAAKGISAHQFAVKPDPATFAALSERARADLFIDAFHADALNVAGIRLAQPNGASGTIGHIDFADLSRQKIGVFSVDDLMVDEAKDKSHVKLKHLEMRDIPADVWIAYAKTGVPPADKLQLFDLGALQLVDFSVQPGTGGEQNVRIAKIDAGRISRQKLESFVVTGIEVDNPNKPEDGVTIGTVEVRGIDWAQVLPLIGRDDVITKLGEVGYRVDKVSIRDVGGPGLDTIGAVLHEISFSGGVDIDSGKETSLANIDRFDMDVSKVKDPQVSGLLTALGYDRISLSMETAGTGDRKAGTTSLDKMRIFGPQIGDLNLTFALSDYHRAASTESASLDQALAPLLAARLQRLGLSWHDDGLTTRLLKFLGEQNGATPEQMRDGLVEQVKGFGEAYQNAPMVAAAVQAIVDYLNKPGTITIDAKPPAPPPLGELGSTLSASDSSNVPETFRLLGITVTAQ